MSDSRPVHLSATGPPSTVLDPEPPDAVAALAAAIATTDPTARRNAVSEVVRRWPAYLEAWATLGDLARDDVEAYAAYRVAYHRGLDRLRASGWRGSGYVRWEHPENRGFLRALRGLGTAARRIGEQHEAERCELFATQLDPG